MNYTQNAPVNTNGELVATAGTGDSNIAGYLTQQYSGLNLGGSWIVNSNFQGALNWNYPGVSGMDLTLVGNLTAGSIVYGAPPKGYELVMILTQDATGGRTVTLGSSFVTGAGAAITISGSAANSKCIMRFMSDGSKLVLQGNQSPAFI